MAQGQGSRHSISYVPEVTFGTTPSTPAMIELPNTGATLKVSKNTFPSNTIRNDRQMTDLRHGVRRADGNINFEFAYGAFDAFLEAALFGTWSTNVLKVGTTAKFFTIERAFADVSEYQPFTGCMIDTFNLDIAVDAMITGSFGILGTGSMTPASSPLDASVTAAPTNPPFDGFTGSITEGGGAANITAMSLSLANNLNPSYVIGTDTAPEILAGRSMLTGELSAFFESEALLNKFLNETESALSVTLEGASGGDLTILVPRIKYTDGAVDVQSADEGLIARMPWHALRDSTEATNLKLTRVPA